MHREELFGAIGDKVSEEFGRYKEVTSTPRKYDWISSLYDRVQTFGISASPVVLVPSERKDAVLAMASQDLGLDLASYSVDVRGKTYAAIYMPSDTMARY